MYGKVKKIQMKRSSANEKQLVELYPDLKRYCCFLSKNEWDGNDLTQETMLKAIKHYGEGAQITKALLHKIAYHHWIDMLRSRQKEHVAFLLEEGTAKDNLILETVETVVEKLTPKQAIMFTLKEGFQYKLTEIAELTGISETAVKSSLHRAKERLKKEESFAENYWNEEDRDEFSILLKRSLMLENPSLLIERAAVIQEQRNKTFGLPANHQKKSSPSFFLYMAA
ncbi:sigma-70 family RNA polymerase sigma factor [Cytobacillus gottheilii]|uniref:Sigma-70 family RNA polymerase sigma factor n=1 Tax=Cytobacillus gottheilii TaxID=859144 RepID=A0ABX8F9N4_9BACI|nr:sigma-70 family RNA polymerase sigma factor [Cytobacillus gottheilii]QVY60874.1 sigma-70 family RNA polymerase sigma factor [Cytobacillus gottheilii]